MAASSNFFCAKYTLPNQYCASATFLLPLCFFKNSLKAFSAFSKSS